ncbi:hypothetical protein FJZ31_17740 [Candidatus Poribacteria bacterium]|nr:hypothetical protein [Candidatus Poribacteria bacterium]
MVPLKASQICIVEGIEEVDVLRQRARRLEDGIKADSIEHVGDAELNQIVIENKLNSSIRHGMRPGFEPIVIFNKFRFDEPPETKEKRRAEFPALFANARHNLSGYGGFDWRDSGSKTYQERTGIVCQPAWQIHTIWGCHYRCAYCSLGQYINIMMNLEEFVERLDGYIKKAPGQMLYQYDNGTDTVCFEPEYGGARLLVKYFAKRENEYLELYVGKSDNIDYLLDFDHRGHTVCCWSISGETQSTYLEAGTASMHDRIASAQRCQDAGYHVRFRFSPIIPVRNWEKENREMIEHLFAETRPDVITFETLRFLNYDAIENSFDLSLLEPEFVQVMKDNQGEKHLQGCEIPHDYRKKVYRFIIDELERISPRTPYALCRAPRVMWDEFAEDFARHGQTPDYYVCNCGPTSAPEHELLCI